MTKNLKFPLFGTRVLIVLFLLPWVSMRFTNPAQIEKIAAKFYKLSWLPSEAMMGIAILWALLLLAFAVGFKKKISYGLVFLLHTLTTITSLPYMIPGTANFNKLFLASLPVVGAMLLLYILRDEDVFLAVDKPSITS